MFGVEGFQGWGRGFRASGLRCWVYDLGCRVYHQGQGQAAAQADAQHRPRVDGAPRLRARLEEEELRLDVVDDEEAREEERGAARRF